MIAAVACALPSFAVAGELCGLTESGDCCVANGTPGCSQDACCALVCAQDPVCCATVWDDTCVEIARRECPLLCPSVACPGEGDCCREGSGPGCNDAECCGLVCADDAQCCDGLWDQRCAARATALCADLCDPSPCPGEGDCCAANATPGCDTDSCCVAVCDRDPDCCAVVWDETCASLAATACPELCDSDSCPGEGDCCSDNGTPGCKVDSCCRRVCAESAGCCDVVWDDACAELAAGLCDPPVTCFGDADGDGHADLADWSLAAVCLTGPDLAPDPAAPPPSLTQCLAAFDSDGDNDVDLVDIARFAAYFTGGP